jgi:hypothetical protein
MMKEGGFALIDCLGFKGIWRRTDVSTLLDKLAAIQEEVKGRVAGFKSQPTDLHTGKIDMQVSLISDTVAVSVQYKKESLQIDDLNKAFLVWETCLAAVQVQSLFLLDEPPLVMRGCVTYGDHVVRKNFLVGPAVDEAAQHYELAQGAFIWLSPSAATIYEAGKWLLGPGDSLLIEYKVPLKDGQRLQTHVVNPLYLENSAEDRGAVCQRFGLAMAGASELDVLLKRQNTTTYLQKADSQSTVVKDVGDATEVPQRAGTGEPER